MSSPDDDDDIRHPHRRDRTPVAVTAVGGLVLAGFAVLVVLFLAEFTRDERVAPIPLRTREELRQQLAGKTRDEVRGVLGRPTDEDAGPDHHWAYRNSSRDPDTGLPDPMVHVHFGPDGRVSRVDFDPPEQSPLDLRASKPLASTRPSTSSK